MIMEIINLGHAAFLFNGKEVSFVVDPYMDESVPNLRFPRVSANYVFKSHNHSDHNAIDLVKIVPTDVELDYDTIVVAHDHHNGVRRGLNKIHIFHVDGLKLIHVGDLGCTPLDSVLDQLKGADVVLAPINGHFTIGSDELLRIANIIKPKLLIPMHYYIASNNSGYPDGNQIERFKSLVKTYYEVNDYRIEINDETLNKKVIIFNKALQEDE